MIGQVSLLVMLVKLVDRVPAPPPPVKRGRGRPKVKVQRSSAGCMPLSTRRCKVSSISARSSAGQAPRKDQPGPAALAKRRCACGSACLGKATPVCNRNYQACVVQTMLFLAPDCYR